MAAGRRGRPCNDRPRSWTPVSRGRPTSSNASTDSTSPATNLHTPSRPAVARRRGCGPAARPRTTRSAAAAGRCGNPCQTWPDEARGALRGRQSKSNRTRVYYRSTVPKIVDYADVTARMAADGMRSLYFNSGAFGFAADQTVYTRGWIGPPDDSIREAAKPFVRQVTPPDEATLATLAARAWQELFHGDVWVLPMSHWAYELDFGS